MLARTTQHAIRVYDQLRRGADAQRIAIVKYEPWRRADGNLPDAGRQRRKQRPIRGGNGRVRVRPRDARWAQSGRIEAHVAHLRAVVRRKYHTHAGRFKQ